MALAGAESRPSSRLASRSAPCSAKVRFHYRCRGRNRRPLWLRADADARIVPCRNATEDELLDVAALVAFVREHLRTHRSWQRVSVLPDTWHLGVLLRGVENIGSFVRLVANSYASVPRPSYMPHARLEDFDRLHMIGRGAFAEVFLVRHRASGTVLAMKAMSKAHLLRLRHAQHAVEERRVLQRLNHPFLLCLVRPAAGPPAVPQCRSVPQRHRWPPCRAPRICTW